MISTTNSLDSKYPAVSQFYQDLSELYSENKEHTLGEIYDHISRRIEPSNSLFFAKRWVDQRQKINAYFLRLQDEINLLKEQNEPIVKYHQLLRKQKNTFANKMQKVIYALEQINLAQNTTDGIFLGIAISPIFFALGQYANYKGYNPLLGDVGYHLSDVKDAAVIAVLGLTCIGAYAMQSLSQFNAQSDFKFTVQDYRFKEPLSIKKCFSDWHQAIAPIMKQTGTQTVEAA